MLHIVEANPTSVGMENPSHVSSSLKNLTSVLERVRQLRDEPHTQKEAEAAIGLRTDNRRPERMVVDDGAMELEAARAALVSPQAPIETMDEDDDAAEYNAFFDAYSGQASTNG